jgi:hypothetical protein
VPVPIAQASTASSSSAHQADLPALDDIWQEVASKMDPETLWAFRQVNRAALAVAKPLVTYLKVRNSQDLALALKAYEGADIAKLELDGSNFTDTDLQLLPPRCANCQ